MLAVSSDSENSKEGRLMLAVLTILAVAVTDLIATGPITSISPGPPIYSNRLVGGARRCRRNLGST